MGGLLDQWVAREVCNVCAIVDLVTEKESRDCEKNFKEM